MAKAKDPKQVAFKAEQLAREEGVVVLLVPNQPHAELLSVARSKGMNSSEALVLAMNEWVERNRK